MHILFENQLLLNQKLSLSIKIQMPTFLFLYTFLLLVPSFRNYTHTYAEVR